MNTKKMKAVTFSYDDAVTQDQRLIELFDRYGLKCTFNLNSGLLGKAGMLIRENVTVAHVKPRPEEIRAIAEFAVSLGSVKEMHLLPYHRIGSDKYAGLGRAYTMAHIQPPDKETMQGLLEVVNRSGLCGQIGG